MRFVRVKTAPEQLQKGEFVIEAPSFLEEVMTCENKRPRNHVMSINYLREVVATIGFKYVGETFNPLTDVNISNYKGTPCEDTKQSHETIVRLFKEFYPRIFDAYVEYHIKRRPNGTNLIYFLGAPVQAVAFVNLGFEEILEKNLNKTKKIISKTNSNEQTTQDILE